MLDFIWLGVSNTKYVKNILIKNYCLQHDIQQERGIGACRKMKKRNRTNPD